MKLVQTTESLRRDFTPDGVPTTFVTGVTFEIRDDNGSNAGNITIRDHGIDIRINCIGNIGESVALVRKMFANVTEE